MENLRSYVRELFDDVFGTEGNEKPITGRDVRDIAIVVISELTKRLLERSIAGKARSDIQRLPSGESVDFSGLEGNLLNYLLQTQCDLLHTKSSEVEALRVISNKDSIDG